MNRKRVFQAAIVFYILSHIFLGFYSAFLGGDFLFGATFPLRYLINQVRGSSLHVTFSGRAVEVAGDVCFRDCDRCPLNCYLPDDLKLVCGDSCSVQTINGVALMGEGESTYQVIKLSQVFENPTFKCVDGRCGFEVVFEDGQRYLSYLPEKVT